MTDFEFDRPKLAGANLGSKPSNCRTCDGDRFVVVATRRIKATVWMKERKIEPPVTDPPEEYAPCPDCNASADTSFFRHDRTLARTLDPAQVRQMMKS